MLDLSEMNFEQLSKLKVDLDARLEDFDGRHREETMRHLNEVAQAHGFKSADAVVNGRLDRRRNPVQKKFFNPADPNIKWSGRGRKPRWFTEALERGVTKEQMTIV
jgi:DNA-binding protein H-NS